MNIKLRPETPEDFDAIHNLIIDAFKDMEMSDKSEQDLVRRLRSASLHIPEICFVALADEEIVGHIFISRIHIKTPTKNEEVLALAPVSVHPDFQSQGMGSLLINRVHEEVKKMDFKAIVLIGHPDYYPRFGYKMCKDYNIKMPFPVPDPAAMVYEIFSGALDGVEGEVVYPKAFFN